MLLKRLQILYDFRSLLSCKCLQGFGSHISIRPNFEHQRHYCFIIWSFYNQHHIVFSESVVSSNQFSTCFFDRCFKGTVTVCRFLILLIPCSVQFTSKMYCDKCILWIGRLLFICHIYLGLYATSTEVNTKKTVPSIIPVLGFQISVSSLFCLFFSFMVLLSTILLLFSSSIYTSPSRMFEAKIVGAN